MIKYYHVLTHIHEYLVNSIAADDEYTTISNFPHYPGLNVLGTMIYYPLLTLFFSLTIALNEFE
jgi:hypothetical protein